MGFGWVFWCWIQGVIQRKRSSKRYLISYHMIPKVLLLVHLCHLINQHIVPSLPSGLLDAKTTVSPSVVSFSSEVKLKINLFLLNQIQCLTETCHFTFGLGCGPQLPWRPQLAPQTVSDTSFKHKCICAVQHFS